MKKLILAAVMLASCALGFDKRATVYLDSGTKWVAVLGQGTDDSLLCDLYNGSKVAVSNANYYVWVWRHGPLAEGTLSTVTGTPVVVTSSNLTYSSQVRFAFSQSNLVTAVRSGYGAITAYSTNYSTRQSFAKGVVTVTPSPEFELPQSPTSPLPPFYETERDARLGLSNRVAGIEGRTNAWNAAVSGVVTITNNVQALESRTNFWNAAYGWGNWASSLSLLAGRTSAIEGKTNNWDTAYGWGNWNPWSVSVSGRTNFWNAAYGWGNWAPSLTNEGAQRAQGDARGSNYVDSVASNLYPRAGGPLSEAASLSATITLFPDIYNRTLLAGGSLFVYSYVEGDTTTSVRVSTDSVTIRNSDGSSTVYGKDGVVFTVPGGAASRTMSFPVPTGGGMSDEFALKSDVDALAATNVLTRAMIAAIQARTNAWEAAHAWGDWSPRVGALEGRSNAWNTAVALAGSALQPSWAATGTVSRALTASDANRIVQVDSNAWITAVSGTGILWRVERTLDVRITQTNGVGYNGPAAGIVFTNVTWNGSSWSWWAGSANLQSKGEAPSSSTNNTIVFAGKVWDSISGNTIPVTLSAVGISGAAGQISLDWVTTTNSYQIATQVGTVILISEHDAAGASHPTLPRYDSVSNIVSAATNGLLSATGSGASLTGVVLPNHTGDVSITGNLTASRVLITTDQLTTAPADDEAVTAGWSRSRLSFGKAAYMTTNLFAAAWQPTNTTGIAAYDPAESTSMVFSVGAVGSYVATMVDTNPVPADVPLVGPATVALRLGIAGGSPSANYYLGAKPELYYTYDLAATNLTLGDFSADPQTWTSGQTETKTYSLSWPTVQPTNTYYRAWRLKVDSKGSAINSCRLYVGGTTASYVLFATSGQEASAVAANLASHEGLSVHASFSATDIAAKNGMTNGMTAANSLMLAGLSAANYYQSQQANEKVGTNDTKYLSIPLPGCLDLGTGQTLTVSGSHIYYHATPAGVATVTVSKAVASGWTYSLTVVSTNAIVAANATLLNTWTLGGTNTYLFTPGTNAWFYRGLTP